MNEVFANRLIAGDLKWSKVPARYAKGVEAVLRQRVKDGMLSEEQLAGIMAE